MTTKKSTCQESKPDSPDLWLTPFSCLSRVAWIKDHKRGIYRSTQQYDPFVYTALKAYDAKHSTDFLQRVKGKSRVAGGDASILKRLQAYDRPSFVIPDKYRRAYNCALHLLKRKLKVEKKIAPMFIYDVDIISNTSSGYPHYKKKGDIKDTIFSEARTLFHFMKRKDFSDLHTPFCTPATRGSSRPAEEEKTRLVWMYPAAMLIAEGVFAQPLIKHFYNDWFASDLFLTGRDGVRKHRSTAASVDEEDIGVGLDFSSFDAINCTEMIRDCFMLLDDTIDHGAYLDKNGVTMRGGVGVERRSRKAFQNVMEFFINTPLILPNGRVIRKHTGVPSGSHFTNLIDSLINWLMHTTWSIYDGLKMKNLRVNGDDSLFLCNVPIQEVLLPRAAEFFNSAFNMVINQQKSCIAHDPGGLHASGTKWRQLVPTRTTQEWLELAINPKSYTTSVMEAFQRLMGIGICGGFGDSMYCDYFNYFQRGYNCRFEEQKMDWTKYRWIEMAFGEMVDLPVYWKSERTRAKILQSFTL